MRKTLCVAALVLALCGPAFAGDIPCPPAPEPKLAATAGESAVDGDIPTPSLAEEVATETMLTLLGNLLALL